MIKKEKQEYDKKIRKEPFIPSISLQDFIKEKETEKFLYFCYCLDSSPLIIKAPDSNDAQKKFLGYEWSTRKGYDGIHYKLKEDAKKSFITKILEKAGIVPSLNTLLDSIPTPPQKGWEKVKMQSLAKSLSAGGDKPKVFSESKTQECPIPIYANSTQNKGFMAIPIRQRLHKMPLQYPQEEVGYAVARYEPFMPIVRLIVLIPDEKIANLRFLEFSINNNEIQNSGSNIPQLTVPEFANIQIPLPPLEMQEKITFAISKIEEKIQILNSSLENLQAHKNKILQNALNLIKDV